MTMTANPKRDVPRFPWMPAIGPVYSAIGANQSCAGCCGRERCAVGGLVGGAVFFWVAALAGCPAGDCGRGLPGAAVVDAAGGVPTGSCCAGLPRGAAGTTGRTVVVPSAAPGA